VKKELPSKGGEDKRNKASDPRHSSPAFTAPGELPLRHCQLPRAQAVLLLLAGAGEAPTPRLLSVSSLRLLAIGEPRPGPQFHPLFLAARSLHIFYSSSSCSFLFHFLSISIASGSGLRCTQTYASVWGREGGLPAPSTDPSWLRPEMGRPQNAKNLCRQMWICEPPALSRALASSRGGVADA